MTAALARLLVDPAADPQSVLLQYGLLGVVVLALAVFAKSAIDRERARTDAAEARADRAEAANAELNREFRTELVPLMTDVSRVLLSTHDLITRDRRR